MHYEEMLSWLLFYNSLLDVTKTPQLDVIDPGGIVRSQVVQTADGSLRIALNASQSQQTLSSRFLTHYFGSGVQHIALATADIVATVQQASRQRRGHAADPGKLLRRPRGADRSCRGTARRAARPRHPVRPRRGRRISPGLYRSFEDLFFFEIVERRGYKGFGAVNASIRLAAQTREAKS